MKPAPGFQSRGFESYFILNFVEHYGVYPICNNKTGFEILNNTPKTDLKLIGVTSNKNTMEENKVKSGKEILDDFFKEISTIENVDKTIADSLANYTPTGN